MSKATEENFKDLSQSSLNVLKVYKLIGKISQNNASGKLLLASGKLQWLLYFCCGKLTWAFGKKHRVRRWLRALQEYCSGLAAGPTQPLQREPWEYHLLLQGLQNGNIEVAQAQSMIKSVTREVLFAATGQAEMACRWQASNPESLCFNLDVTLSVVDLKPLLEEIQHLHDRWQLLGLNPILSDRAIGLKETAPSETGTDSSTFLTAASLFDGERTFWDLVMKLDRSVTVATRVFHHFIQQNRIATRDMPDLSPPFVCSNPKASPVSAGRDRPLIACIDDSPQVRSAIEKMVTRAGYQFVGCPDPVQAIPLLLECRPAVIFLDLVMPIANGYEVCAQIRRVSALKSTPVVILTSNDGVIDRVRAKVVGSSEFVGKPVSTQKILSTIQKYLSPNRSPDSVVGPLKMA